MGAGLLTGTLAITALLGGCQDSYDEPSLEVPEATWVANTSVADFKAAFRDEMAVETPEKDAEEKIPYILKGRVISSDASGNIYKSIVIQDRTGALAFSVNQSSMYVDFRLGQEVLVNATGLWMGQYNSLLQMGWLGEYNGNPQITFMAYDIFNGHVQKNGLPNQDFATIKFGDAAPEDAPYYTRITLEELGGIVANSEEYYSIMSQLVEIPYVSFVDAGQDPPVTFSTYQNNADRYITDESGQQLNVRCSGYSSFYNDPLPEGTGTIRGILSRYGSDWQLMLRGIDDCVGFSTKGRRDNPYTVEEAITLDNSGREAWVEGVIIGSVKGGVSEVTSAADIAYSGSETQIGNNLVIAPEAGCRDVSRMMVVNLPDNSMIRKYANLLDYPELIGRKILVQGSLNPWLGLHALTNVGSGLGVFSIENYNPGGLEHIGAGTEDDPFSPAYIALAETEMEGVWIEGYIVGFVVGRSYDNGAVFAPYDGRDNFSGNNFILGDARNTDSKEKAIPVMLPNSSSSLIRDEYNLMDHPELYKKRVLIKGNVGKTFNAFGISEVSEILIKTE